MTQRKKREIIQELMRRKSRIMKEGTQRDKFWWMVDYIFIAYRKRVLLIIFSLLLVAVIGYSYLLLPFYDVKKELVIEAGSDMPKVSDFLRWDNEYAEIVSGLSAQTDLNTVATYPVVVRIYNKDISTKLRVKDTKAPVVTTKDQIINYGSDIEPSDFIEEISDMTKTTVAFKNDPDLEAEGTQKVAILVADEGGNVTEVSAILNIVSDTEPPVISGVTELTTYVGGSISYKKGVTVTDNYDEEVELLINNSQVNLNEPGDYIVVYSAADKAGNQTSVTTTVHVKSIESEDDGTDILNEEADAILASILTDDMSLYEKAEAIYWWCHEKIAYADGTPKEGYAQGAYQGLVNRRGDCYTYAMSAKCLLTRAGIPNMDIERIPSGDMVHYWNLVDLGDGWQHFDTTRRKDGTTFFLMSDADITAYSDAHDGTHNYDRSKYPTIL